jgi:general secretion pathway protein N
MTRALFALLLLLAVLATLAIRAPAAWIADALAAHTPLRLVDPRGSVWQGSAQLGISNGRQTTLLPGRVAWTMAGLRSGRLWARLSHDWLTAPVELGVDPRSVAVAKGSARLPAAALAAGGAPFNTLRPGGLLELAWTDAVLERGGALTGELQVDWRDAKSALSPVVPLGTYRLRVAGRGGPASLELRTLSGPLEMRGNGRIEGSHVKFSGVAAAERDMRPALDGLLGLLGVRSGDKVLLAVDT